MEQGFEPRQSGSRVYALKYLSLLPFKTNIFIYKVPSAFFCGTFSCAALLCVRTLFLAAHITGRFSFWVSMNVYKTILFFLK